MTSIDTYRARSVPEAYASSRCPSRIKKIIFARLGIRVIVHRSRWVELMGKNTTTTFHNAWINNAVPWTTIASLVDDGVIGSGILNYSRLCLYVFERLHTLVAMVTSQCGRFSLISQDLSYLGVLPHRSFILKETAEPIGSNQCIRAWNRKTSWEETKK